MWGPITLVYWSMVGFVALLLVKLFEIKLLIFWKSGVLLKYRWNFLGRRCFLGQVTFWRLRHFYQPHFQLFAILFSISLTFSFFAGTLKFFDQATTPTLLSKIRISPGTHFINRFFIFFATPSYKNNPLTQPQPIPTLLPKTNSVTIIYKYISI